VNYIGSHMKVVFNFQFTGKKCTNRARLVKFVCSFVHSFIHSFIPLACVECNDPLPFSGTSYIPLSYVLFPVTLLHQSSLTSSCHLFLGLPVNLVVPKFIYNTLLGILFSSILCTCPSHRNQPCCLHYSRFFNTCINFFIG
jgi:hypothetical protein